MGLTLMNVDADDFASPAAARRRTDHEGRPSTASIPRSRWPIRRCIRDAGRWRWDACGGRVRRRHRTLLLADLSVVGVTAWSTCSWWRRASISRWSAVRDLRRPRSVSSSEISTDVIAKRA